ncbi:30S ribosomal protein S4 [Candidatus Tiddalikarchaeum anstoanum]|nr:30S ribosomal protein S4 [Candidatus Tiddalikarchaeum anstoanum]
MGQPKLPRKKFLRPGKPWEKNRILVEKELTKKYGYKNKKEIWRMSSLLRGFRAQARRITALANEQAKKEGENLIKRLLKLGLLEKDSNLDDVLDLTIDNISERRLLTQVMKKGIARTPKQARQFITHRHISVGDRKVTSPNYLVLKDEEGKISFSGNSPFNNKDHPLIEQMKNVGKKGRKEESTEAPKKEEHKEAKKEAPKKEEHKKEEQKEAPKKEEKKIKGN